MKRCRSTAVSNVGTRLCPVRIATREVGRDIHEVLRYCQVAQRVVATRTLQAQRLAALRRDIASHDQRAFPPVDLHPEAAAGPGGGGDMGRSHRATRQLSADQHVVRRGNLHQLLRVGLVPVPGLGRDHTRHPREGAHDEV
jgi:hypothetical protein